MNSESNGHARYKVVPVATVKTDLRRFYKQQLEEGQGAAFLDILRRVYEKLRTKPHDFGEALYHLPALKLLVHQGVISRLVVTYGVHDEHPLVVIRGVQLLSSPGT
jgi:hypothetical protein